MELLSTSSEPRAEVPSFLCACIPVVLGAQPDWVRMGRVVGRVHVGRGGARAGSRVE